MTEQEIVITIEDITHQSRRWLTFEVYTDSSYSTRIVHHNEPCPPGSILHAERMTRERADALGLTYVVPSGDLVQDEHALQELKREMRDSSTQGVVRSRQRMSLALPESGMPQYHTTASCAPIYYYTKYLCYSAEGGRVRVGVRYQDDEYGQYGCNTIVIYQSFAYLTQPLYPGEDLFWDQEYYEGGINAGSWDMGCQEFDNDGSVNYTWQGNWLGFANEWFTDESINDTSLGCEWWGEEYTGQMILDVY